MRACACACVRALYPLHCLSHAAGARGGGAMAQAPAPGPDQTDKTQPPLSRPMLSPRLGLAFPQLAPSYSAAPSVVSVQEYLAKGPKNAPQPSQSVHPAPALAPAISSAASHQPKPSSISGIRSQHSKANAVNTPAPAPTPSVAAHLVTASIGAPEPSQRAHTSAGTAAAAPPVGAPAVAPQSRERRSAPGDASAAAPPLPNVPTASPLGQASINSSAPAEGTRSLAPAIQEGTLELHGNGTLLHSSSLGPLSALTSKPLYRSTGPQIAGNGSLLHSSSLASGLPPAAGPVYESQASQRSWNGSLVQSTSLALSPATGLLEGDRGQHSTVLSPLDAPGKHGPQLEA